MRRMRVRTLPEPFDAFPSRTAGMMRALCLFSLVIALTCLVPFVHASPSDPSWVAGIYDDADFDEIVAVFAATTWLVECPITLPKPTSCEGRLERPDNPTKQRALLSPLSIRSPPSLDT
jgi:hypothetical protein